MPALRSSVLIICHPRPDTVSFGADFAADYAAAHAQIREYPYPVVALPSEPERDGKDIAFLDDLNRAAPLSQRVIIQNQAPPEALRRMINKGNVFKILATYDDPQFERTMLEALEEYSLIRQNAKLLSLVNEQNDRLRKLSFELEERVEKRQKFLEDARSRLLGTNHRVEALHRALVAVHQATSIAEMERLTNEALSAALGLSWTRIILKSQSHLEPERNASLAALLNVPLMRGGDDLGRIYFARETGMAFNRDESSFLVQIADAVSLAIDRLGTLEQSETLKHQWEATFDAILDPVSLISGTYTVQRINRAFAERGGIEPEKIIGRKCHEALFGRKTPCDGCSIGSNFRLKPARTLGGADVTYDVFSQAIRFKPRETDLYVNMYHDVSAQLRLEGQILERAKMAELGIIGSSIAHELNNPLGGMLSFLQLIKMDLSGDEPYYDDILEMEAGAHRCREIVKSLLGFTRKPSTEETGLIDLRDVVDQALKITELQTRAMGIQVLRETPSSPVLLRGQFNFLAQAVRNLLQNAQEALSVSQRNRPDKVGEISIILSRDENGATLEIANNGSLVAPGMESTARATHDASPGLGLNVAFRIIRDHGGEVEISSQPDKGTTARIFFPAQSPAFDGINT